MNVLGLFSGIGGFELGFQRAGFTIAAMCEIEPYAQSVLRRHWPGVPLYADVRELTGERLRCDGIHVDVITGGFPCQDISLAGKGAGLGGERSGLWREYLRVIREVRPSWVVIENVSALRSRGLDTVLRQLAEIGYDAEWHCIPASAIGAPHRRDRIWIVAYADRSDSHGRDGLVQMGRLALKGKITHNGHAGRTQWGTEPGVGRVAHGVPFRMDRCTALGNAVVPQIPEAIALAIRTWELFDG